jgi:hypothetical protein
VIKGLINKKSITNNNINDLLSRNKSNSTTNRLISRYGLKRQFIPERSTTFTNRLRKVLIPPEEAIRAKANAKAEAAEPVPEPVPPIRKKKKTAEKVRLERQKQSEQELRNNINNFQSRILKEIREKPRPHQLQLQLQDQLQYQLQDQDQNHQNL